MRYERNIGKSLIVAHCGEDLNVQVVALLDKLYELHHKGPPLSGGSIIQFGWSRFYLNEKQGELVLSEPEFSNNPYKDNIPSVDTSLRVIAAQAAICNAVNATGQDVSFDQTIVLTKHSVNTPEIYLDRRIPNSPSFSGWYLGPFDDTPKGKDEPQLEILPTYRLLEIRPVVLHVLQLPYDYIVIIQGETVEAIINSKKQMVWPPRSPDKYHL